MENKYFKQALSSLVNSVAFGDAVIHMHNSGLTIEEIQKKLDYPASLANIEKIINEYETKKSSPDNDYEYVQTQDEFGRKSFIKIKKS